MKGIIKQKRAHSSLSRGDQMWSNAVWNNGSKDDLNYN